MITDKPDPFYHRDKRGTEIKAGFMNNDCVAIARVKLTDADITAAIFSLCFSVPSAVSAFDFLTGAPASSWYVLNRHEEEDPAFLEQR
jgi:hypothetical protein